MRVLSDPVLAATASGTVAQCACCNGLAVAFGDTRVTLQPDQLRALCATVREVEGEADRPGACWGWRLRTQTAREEATFHLTIDTAAELAELLGAAVAALDLDALLTDVLAVDP